MVGLLAALAGVCMTGKSSKPIGAPMDPELLRAADAAHAAYMAGSLNAAIELYGAALKRARLMDNGVEIARNAYNLAVCLTAAGRLDEGRKLVRESRLESLPNSFQAGVADLLEAKIMWRKGRTEETVLLLESAQRAFGTKPPAHVAAQVHLLLAAVACEEGDHVSLETDLVG